MVVSSPEDWDLEGLQAAAEEACLAAGDLMVGAGPTQRVAASKSNAKDLLTATDLACQARIRDMLTAAYPNNLGFVGEEDLADGAIESLSLFGEAPCWVVDPIDGTANFVDGIPLSTVSIACVAPGAPSRTLVGCVYDPHRRELFSAARGRGATLKTPSTRARLQVSPAARLADAIVYAGAPPNPRSLAPSLRGINAIAPKARTLRLLGSAALMLAYVAAGRGAAYFEPDLCAWDTAAGCLLVDEAGGTCTDAAGSPYSAATTRQILASNGHLHSDILTLLNEEDALSLDD